MNYDMRMQLIRNELMNILGTYAIPKHLEDEKRAQTEVEGICRLINQKFPNDTNEEHIRGTMDRAMLKLKEAHKSRSWPTSAEISAAVSKSMSSASTRSVSSGPGINSRVMPVRIMNCATFRRTSPFPSFKTLEKIDCEPAGWACHSNRPAVTRE